MFTLFDFWRSSLVLREEGSRAGEALRRAATLAQGPQLVIESRVRAGAPGDRKNLARLDRARSAQEKTGETTMANSLLPPEERHLTPDQVEALDKRRDLGHTLLVIAGQFAAIATILLLWVGQDLAYSPGWARPMAYYFAIALVIIAVCGVVGFLLRRGTPRID